MAHGGQELGLDPVGGLGLIAGFGEFVAEFLKPGVLRVLAPDVAHQQAHEQQQHQALHPRERDHQQALLSQLRIAFVDEAGHGPVGFTCELPQVGLQLGDPLAERAELRGGIGQGLWLQEQGVGHVLERPESLQGGGVQR